MKPTMFQGEGEGKGGRDGIGGEGKETLERGRPREKMRHQRAYSKDLLLQSLTFSFNIFHLQPLSFQFKRPSNIATLALSSLY